MIVDLDASVGEVIWRPDSRTQRESHVERFARFVAGRGTQLAPGYAALWRWSVDNPDAFWSNFVEFAGVKLGGEVGPTHDGMPMPDRRWFPGRTVNFARHLLEGWEGTALIGVAEGGDTETISYEELRGRVGALAAHLRSIGVESGDRVVAVLPNIPEAAIAFLAASSLGAIWSICAPEFGPGAIVSRFRQLEPKVLIAAPGYRLGGTDRDRREEIASVIDALDGVSEVIWVTSRSSSVEAPMVSPPSLAWEDVLRDPHPPVFADVDFSHPLWVLFSSGTTGVPKGIVHGHGGALLEELQMLMFGGDLRSGDRHLSVASTSWVVWNSLISSLGVGASAILIDGNPSYPSLDRVWQVASATRANLLGVGASFIHSCAKTTLIPRSDHDLSSLRAIQVTGSPLSADGFRWVYRNVGDVWLASMSGGTDIAGCFVGGAVTEPVRVGYIQAPALGVSVEAWNDAGEIAVGTGELVVTAPMPSMPLYFWGDEDGRRYRESYFDTFPGVWRHGDFIEISERGILVLGRSDSTLNRNGIRLGSADIYAIVDGLPEIAESMVVGAELDDEEYYMPLFVQLADGHDLTAATDAVVRAIRANLSVRYLPDEIIPVRGIPHTKTGKKLEVPVKRLLQGSPLSAVADPGSVDDPDLLVEFAEFARSRPRRRPAGR